MKGIVLHNGQQENYVAPFVVLVSLCEIQLIQTLIARRSQFHQTVKLLRGQVVVKKVNRVNRRTIFMHFVVAVWAGAFARAAHPTNNFATFYTAAWSGFYANHVSV